MKRILFPSIVICLCVAGALCSRWVPDIAARMSLQAADAPSESNQAASPAKAPPAVNTEPAPPGANEPAVAPLPRYPSALIGKVPHVKQKHDFCGEACAEMYLSRLGYPINQDDVFDQALLDPELGRGCYTRELQTALTRIGFDLGPVWYRVAADRADVAVEAHVRAMCADLAAGIPSIVCMHFDDQPDTTEHFRLIVGYDRNQDEILYHEPAIAGGAYLRMSHADFLELWPLKYAEDRWTLIRLRLKPGTIRNVHSTAKFTNADYAQQVIRLKNMSPDDFSVVVQKPFVVIGDEPAATVRRRATGTVEWAVERLKRDYFTEDPDDILAIWLFKDKESYEKHTEEIFGDTPDTPYGYVSYRHKAMIMNISTGGGTLVHEIVHPFIASNFPRCPSWFNEGLGSLYEQSGDNRGRIWGYTNWRLKGLQKFIKGETDEDEDEAEAEAVEEEAEAEKEKPEPEKLPRFRELCGTSTREFYYRDPGTNYAQARYLLYYLQQRGLLRTYYHQFRKNVDQDPSGYETLKQVLGMESEAAMDKFQDDWEAWVLKLQFG